MAEALASNSAHWITHHNGPPRPAVVLAELLNVAAGELASGKRYYNSYPQKPDDRDCRVFRLIPNGCKRNEICIVHSEIAAPY